MSYNVTTNPCVEIPGWSINSRTWWGSNFERFLEDNPSHLIILKMVRSGEITIEHYGRLLGMLWSVDLDMHELAKTIISEL